MLLDILNMGTPELIIMLFVFMFLIGMIFLVIFIFKIIFKKDTTPNFQPPVQHYHVNVGNSEKETLIEESALKKKTTLNSIENDKIALPQQSEIRYANVSEIIRCESDDNYTNFVFANERILVSRSLKEYADLLKPKGFLRTHQSHLVNPHFVKSWLKEDGGLLLLTNGDKIPVSKANREFIKEALS